ncbi:hypothetical protein G6F50_014090 [Rhizopus delemar]|uniref:Uncharacterized protein n=1 Tax=Rhizopus delemar TaxID=936053 RepID=A0A9P6Y963_9FUNG|nr:hypothetical protein G6F50_014090 [Rhizopus delemar]
MISLPTYSIATGSSARIRRRPRLARVSAGLVCQTMRRNGGRLRIALKRWRRLGFFAAAAPAVGVAGMRVLCAPDTCRWGQCSRVAAPGSDPFAAQRALTLPHPRMMWIYRVDQGRHLPTAAGNLSKAGWVRSQGREPHGCGDRAYMDVLAAAPATGPTPPSHGMRLLLSTLLARWPLQAPGAARPIPLNRQATAGTVGLPPARHRRLPQARHPLQGHHAAARPRRGLPWCDHRDGRPLARPEAGRGGRH